MFLLIFRYVFGGAIGTGSVSYADFLIPGLAAAGAFFSGTGAAVGVAEDVDSGLFDRLRSLPVPRSAILLGRSIADTALVAWALFVTVAVGFLTGFRFHGSALDAVAAVALCLVFGAAFSWPFIYMGLVAGNAQAANGMAFMAFPLVFVSSAYVPVESMPGWMQPVAENQPVTMMVGAVRALSLGDSGGRGARPLRRLVRGPGDRLVAGDRRRVRPAGDPALRPPLIAFPGHATICLRSLWPLLG